jgi:hypothetical protein
MFATLFELTLWQIKNTIRVRLRRLGEPRYLIGTIFGIAYIGYFAILRNPSFSARGTQIAADRFARVALPMELGFALMFLVFAAAAWILPAPEHPIRFSPSEVQFLFPAPITRRQLLQYRLLRAQLGTLFGSVMMTLFMRPTTLANSWKFMTGVWLILMTVRIHFTGVGLYREGLRQQKIGGLWKWGPPVLVCGAVAFVGFSLYNTWPALMASSDTTALETLDRLASNGLNGVILWPFRSLTHLPLAGTTPAYFAALPAALIVLLLNYAWVLRADTAFEEGAAIIAEKRPDPRKEVWQPRSTTLRTPFELAPTGRTEPAIIWKNLIMVGRYLRLRTLLPLLPSLIAFGMVASIASRRSGVATVFAVACLILAAFTILIGPLISRNDLRRDLGNLAMLKSWPVSGATLLRGEILAPGVMLSVFAWLFLVGATALSTNLRGSFGEIVNLQRLSYSAAAMMLAPGLILAELTVLNGLAVLFPAWISTGASRSRGIDALGQRLFTTAGVLLTLTAALIPAVLVATIVGGAVYFLSGIVLIVIPAAIVAVVLIVECLAAVEALGAVLDRTDVSDVSPEE